MKDLSNDVLEQLEYMLSGDIRRTPPRGNVHPLAAVVHLLATMHDMGEALRMADVVVFNRHQATHEQITKALASYETFGRLAKACNNAEIMEGKRDAK